MRNYKLSILLCGLVLVFAGCANGPLANRPIRNFFRGAFCNTCNPAAGQATCGTNIAPGCNTGMCGTQVAPAETPMGTPGAFAIPGSGVPYYGDPSLNATPSFTTPPSSTSQSYPATDIYGNGSPSPPVGGQ